MIGAGDTTGTTRFRGLRIERLQRIGRAFFALALIGLGADHFIHRDFILGRAPAWPESVPGGWAWAYLTGIVFIAVGLAILAAKKARAAAILAGMLIFLWALLRHIPLLAAGSFLSPEWTRAGKALWFVGGALAIAATFPALRHDGSSSITRLLNLEREFVIAGRISVGLFLLVTGIQHFMYTEFVASLIPGWFPGDAVFWTYLAGVALIGGGAGILIPYTTQWAAALSGAMIFSWFFIVHISREVAGLGDGIAVFEALAIAGVLFVIAGFPREPKTGSGLVPEEFQAIQGAGGSDA